MINKYENRPCYPSRNISATLDVSHENYTKSANFNTNTNTKFNRIPLNDLRRTCGWVDKGQRYLHYAFPANNICVEKGHFP
jgi:hypothetical protein